ncbi:uncharacterized protein A4U43_C05F12870 [Asparagus officinalis]|uniref:Uncharacterized protein n=1 Tax=Asparagus officinalis TaxID=4686 RepID=A0A5P1ER90_ASPOF|nr:uncharacterized protein A4U43_C05F12870 [Asparagus officinalis]
MAGNEASGFDGRSAGRGLREWQRGSRLGAGARAWGCRGVIRQWFRSERQLGGVELDLGDRAELKKAGLSELMSVVGEEGRCWWEEEFSGSGRHRVFCRVAW